MDQKLSSAGSPALPRIDVMDRKILRLLQDDAMMSLQEISREVGLSQTPCWKRIQKLLAAGVIDRRVAILSPEALGLNLTVFVSVESEDRSAQGCENVAAAIGTLPEVMQLYRLAGPGSFLLQVVVPDEAAFDSFDGRLKAAVPLAGVTPSFVRQRLKAATAYAAV